MTIGETLTVRLKITIEEALAIDMVISHPLLLPRTWLEIGSIICSGEGAEVELTEKELWGLREHTNFTITIGTTHVGLELMKKIYGGLLAIDCQRNLDVQMPLGNKGGENSYAQRIIEWKADDYEEQHRRRQEHGGDFDDPYENGLPAG